MKAYLWQFVVVAQCADSPEFPTVSSPHRLTFTLRIVVRINDGKPFEGRTHTAKAVIQLDGCQPLGQAGLYCLQVHSFDVCACMAVINACVDACSSPAI